MNTQRILATITASALLSVAPAVAEESTIYASGDAWNILRSEEHCSLFIDYQKDTTLYVNYTYGVNTSVMALLNPAFKSVKDGEKYKVEITFIKGKSLDEGWGEKEMVGLNVAGKPGIAVTLDARDLLNDLRVSDTIAFTRDDGDTIVDVLNLKGSADPISKLEKCSLEVHRINPADPFKD